MTPNDNTSTDARQAARETFHGRGLTDTQFEKAWAITDILRAEIESRGTFNEALTDHAHLFSRSEKFDALRGEAILRDIYQGRFGQTLNATRKGLKAAEEALPDAARERALACAEMIGELIQAAPTQPYYKAQDRATVTLSNEFGITQRTAKSLMSETFEAKHGKPLYEHGKQIEAAYHTPARAAEMAARKLENGESRTQSRSLS